MRLIAHWGAGTAPAGTAEIGGGVNRASRQVCAVHLARVLGQPRRARRDIEDEPVPPARAPVGASGSCTSNAKLFVPSGAPDQVSAGEMFLPVQPKPPYTCSIWTAPFGLKSGVVSANRGRAARRFAVLRAGIVVLLQLTRRAEL